MRPKNDEQSIPRYLLANCVIGCVAGLVWGLLMIATDTAGLATLVALSSHPVATGALLLIGSAVVLAPIVLAAAIGALANSGHPSHL